jgi:hypothetical protein
MATDKEFEFQVLLKELDHADKQIGSYMDLQIKILAVVFAILSASLGFLITTDAGKLTPHNVAKLLVVVSVVSSLAVIQSTIYYGIALGYIHCKVQSIAPRLQRLIGLSEPPLQALNAFRQSPTRGPVLLSTAIFFAGILALNAAALGFAWSLVAAGAQTKWLIGGAAVLIIASIACKVMTYGAMKQVGISGDTSPSSDFNKEGAQN